MPSTDDEYRTTARRAFMVLRADLGVALDGPTPGREAARRISTEMRNLCERAQRVLGESGASELLNELQRARARVVSILGTSAWDDGQAVEGDPPSSLPTLTDTQLASLRQYFDERQEAKPIPEQASLQVRSALAELQRLRARVAKLDR